MANFSVSPQGLRFNSAPVQGSIAGLYATPQTLTFVLTNTSGASVTITSYGFTPSTEGDAVTQPVGIYSNSDFTVVPTGGSFPVTVANNATQSFTVTYAPLRRGSGFGDIRSQLVTLFQGYKALSNGGQVLNTAGEVINETVPTLVTVGVGGGVSEEAYDWATVAPIMQGSGSDAKTTYPAGYGSNSPSSRNDGLGANMTLADIDTTEHYSPMLFFTAAQSPVTSPTAVTSTVRGVTVGTPAFGDVAGTGGTITTTLTPATAYDYGSPDGGRGYQILVFLSDDTLGFDLTIQAETGSGPTWTTVATFTGLNFTNVGGLFIGNAEGLNLQGLKLRAVASNFQTITPSTLATTAWLSGSQVFNIGAVITG